jgi:hypothetical protein
MRSCEGPWKENQLIKSNLFIWEMAVEISALL